MKKTKNKNSLQVPSRSTLKIFLVTAALAYVSQAAMTMYFSVKMIFDDQPFGIAPFIIYPVTTVLMPVVVFVILYFVANKNTTKLWRVSRAVLVAFLALIAESFISAINNRVFKDALGYGDSAAGQSAIFIQYIPFVLTIGLAVMAGLWLRTKSKASNQAVIVSFQKMFIILLLLMTIGQNLIQFLGFSSGGVTDVRLNADAMIGFLLSFSVPAVVYGVLYLLISKQHTILQRLFIALIYLLIGMFISIAFMTASYQIGSVADADYVDMVSDVMAVLGLPIFIAIVAWHKMKKII